MTATTNIQDALRNLAGAISIEIGGDHAHLLMVAADVLDSACAAETAFAAMGAGDGGMGDGFYDLARAWGEPRHKPLLAVKFQTNCGEVYSAVDAHSTFRRLLDEAHAEAAEIAPPRRRSDHDDRR